MRLFSLIAPLVAAATLAGCGQTPAATPLAAQNPTTRAAKELNLSAVRKAITQHYTFRHSRPTHVGGITTTSTLTALRVDPTSDPALFGYAGTQAITTVTESVFEDPKTSVRSQSVHGAYNALTGEFRG